MKKSIFASSVLLLMILLVGCQSDKQVDLFNGTDLDNWVLYIEGDEDPTNVFYLEDGLINIAGQPNGYMRTVDSYSNYKLHVEWRWTETPGNSGILFHIQGEDKLWPVSVECQLQSGSAGLVILIGPGTGLTQNDSAYLVIPEVTGNIWIPMFEESSEKAAGEWNTTEIVTRDDGTLEITINGVLQNRASGMTFKEGHILLQSEGAPMQFRNLVLTRLD